MALVLLAGCRHPSHVGRPGVCGVPAPSASASPMPAGACLASDPLDVAAARSMRRARLAEPAVTARLQALAVEAGGDLVGLEHRLKTYASTRRKIKAHVEETGEDPSAYEIYDGLRYTLRVEDEPRGHHAHAAHSVLAALEADGHQVEKVKNYWPRGDTYSGTNCRLRSPEGLAWELQFHTPRSWSTKSKTHDDYDLMRADDTPLEEKRALFRRMTAAWADVEIPGGILVEGALHPKARTVLLPSP